MPESFLAWSSNVLFGEPEAARFLAVVQRLKKMQQSRARQTRLAKQKLRALLRKQRPVG